MSILRPFLILTAAALTLAACSGDEKKPPLQGERLSILDLQGGLEAAAEEVSPLELPQVWKNGFWPQTGGYPNHVLEHLSLNTGELKRAWSADIGAGSRRDLPLTAQPIAADGRLFALNTESEVTAMDAAGGRTLWRADVRKEYEDDPVIGGGLSHNDGMLYVTAGFDELLALSPEDGKILWRVKLTGPARAAPTILDNRVYVSTLNNSVLALDAKNGAVLWEYSAIGESAGLLGAAAPAVTRDIVVPAFSSGEIYALRVENGSVAWSDNLASIQRLGGLGGLADIKGLPVIYNEIVYAVSFGGKMVAIDERNGERIWQKDIGGAQTPWVAGNAVFIVSSDNMVASLDSAKGTVRWVRQLSRFEDNEARKGAISWTGPLLAGGRLILASSDGRLLEISAQDGSVLRETDIGKPVLIPPIIAGDTLYLLSEDGSLLAYR